jgi:hypothetical protein
MPRFRDPMQKTERPLTRFEREVAHWEQVARPNEMVHILRKSSYGWDGRTDGQSIITVAAGIPSADWVSGCMTVRLFEKNTWSATAAIFIHLQPCMFAPEEPDIVFAAGNDVAAFSLSNSDTAPCMKVASFTPPFGPYLWVRMRFSQGGTEAGAEQTVTLGMELVGRAH